MRLEWYKLINPYSALPDSLRYTISLARRDDKLVPKFKDVYKPFSHFQPWETLVVVLGPGEFSPLELSSGILHIPSPRLTSEIGKPDAHAGLGWEREVQHLLEVLSTQVKHVVYFLTGEQTIGYAQFINPNSNFVIFDSFDVEIANEFLRLRGRGQVCNVLTLPSR